MTRTSLTSPALLTGALLLIVHPGAPSAEPSAAEAAAAPAPGHSFHGEAFDEGPRQRAYLMAGMPHLSFPITTPNPLAQQFFTQGIGQLHGFWYLEAERSFRQVHQLDTNCAMAFWGMAMANGGNETRARAFMTNAVALKSNASPREQLYLDALAAYYRTDAGTNSPARDSETRRRDLVRAYEEIVRQNPDDLEAKAFLLYHIWDNSNTGGQLSVSSYLPLDLLAREILDKEPLHPVHHYRIHLWDREGPIQALNSAARCGQGSPGIAHLWHMPGHTYAHLNRHDDAAWQQEASARVDHAFMMRDRVLPDQIHNYAHNNDWLAESWTFVGRVREAIDLAKNMVELPRLARTNAALADSPLAYRYEFRSSSWQLGRRRLLKVLPQFELWDELIALSETPYLEPTDAPEEQARLAHALALAWFARGEVSRATNQLAAVQAGLAAVRAERQGAIDLAEQNARRDRKSSEEQTKAMTAALERFNSRLDALEAFAAEIRARTALAANDTNAMNTELAAARDIPPTSLALLHWSAGNVSKALELAADAATKATNQVQPSALQADLLWRAGKTNDAQTAFGKLREFRAWPDLDLPVIQRLKPIAQSLGLPDDWRNRLPPRDDVGERPSLESLGPRHWQPSPAPAWSLADADGRKYSNADFRGRAVLLLFYLGRGCPHCLEQLNAFTAVSDAFGAQGISIVAIGSDSADGLRRTFQKDGSKRFPFPLLADPEQTAFKAWRAYDDFESTPLHGAFLVDAEGLVRWQDIAAEPFKETGFLLGEAKRLLRMTPGPRVAGLR